MVEQTAETIAQVNINLSHAEHSALILDMQDSGETCEVSQTDDQPDWRLAQPPRVLPTPGRRNATPRRERRAAAT
jgi:hypothetical protein